LLTTGPDFAALHGVVGEHADVGAEPFHGLWLGLGRLRENSQGQKQGEQASDWDIAQNHVMG
jgi:hypothetical protein